VVCTFNECTAANFSAAGADAAATEYELQLLNIGVQFFRSN
jgi:hypothetical protein